MPKEIVAIREEISLIEIHRKGHMEGLKVRQADRSCKYCQPYMQHNVIVKQSQLASTDETVRVPLATANDLERTVEVAGKKGQITVPKSWAGKRVRVTLL